MPERMSRASRRERIGVIAGIAIGVVVIVAIVVAVFAAPARAGRYVGEVDLQIACEQQYPGEARELVLGEEGNPYTWACESAAGEQGGIEVSEECARLYGADAYGKIRESAEDASWVCVTDAAQPTGASRAG